MTREVAIKWLSNLKMDIGKTQHQELWHYEQALDELIQALEQQSPCDICKYEKEDCWEMCQFCPVEPKGSDEK